jgi:V8-like Glu-specific endopeptidase
MNSQRFRLFVLVVLLIFGPCSVDLRAQVLQWVNVAERNKNATVLIRVDSQDQDSNFGSGVIIGPNKILTAKHLLPENETLKRGDYLITGLVGWDAASIDFGQATKLVIEYISSQFDLAVLRFDTSSTSKPHAFSMRSTVKQGEAVLIMGYPGGGSLQCTQGIVSGKGEGETWTTDAIAGVGNSGGPIFDVSGQLVGILLYGAQGRDKNGVYSPGYFLALDRIDSDLSRFRTRGEDFQISIKAGSVNSIPAAEVERITINYSLNDEEISHLWISATERGSRRLFSAQYGFRIISAEFQVASQNHVKDGPQVLVSEDGSSVTLQYSLESGPFFDRWRGWLVGTLNTIQERVSVGKTR